MKGSAQYPNIVLITADQWRGDCLGCAGSRHPVMTPHVDQLAAEGVRFTHAYADCPVCMPQRVTTLTGQVASRFGMPHNFAPATRSPIDGDRCLPARLARQCGYQTEAIGKMHVHPERSRVGFDHVCLHPDDYVMWLEEHGYGGLYRGHGLGGNEIYPVFSAVPEPYTHTHWIVDEATTFLRQRDPDCPFFLWTVFEAPHSPFDPPEEYVRLYERFPIPDSVFGDWTGDRMPPMLQNRVLKGKFDKLSTEVLREARRHYYAQITHIDYQLGRLLGQLKTLGLYDNTVIVFTSDHGEHLGDHGLFGKQTFVSGSADVPLIVRLPESLRSGNMPEACHAPVLTADICPTLLAAAGLDAFEGTDGLSLLPLVQGGDNGRSVVCGEGRDSAFCTDGRWSYLYYPHGGVEQLFDNAGDPENLCDLSVASDAADVKQALQQALVQHLDAFERPMVKDGRLAEFEAKVEPVQARRANPCAWRGPMRYGQGYNSRLP